MNTFLNSPISHFPFLISHFSFLLPQPTNPPTHPPASPFRFPFSFPSTPRTPAHLHPYISIHRARACRLTTREWRTTRHRVITRTRTPARNPHHPCPHVLPPRTTRRTTTRRRRLPRAPSAIRTRMPMPMPMPMRTDTATATSGRHRHRNTGTRCWTRRHHRRDARRTQPWTARRAPPAQA